jgi:hypothetical protein
MLLTYDLIADQPPEKSMAVQTGKPVAYLGQIVIWKPSRDATPEDCCPALVTTGGSIAAMSLFSRDARIAVPKDSVRHVSDPDLAKFDLVNSGCWDYTEADKKAK